MGYTIGQFAGKHQVSKKTLRYYRDIGLLEPAGIDPVNGYAFYEDEQVEKMKNIQYLRRLRFPLEEIRTLLQLEPEFWSDLLQLKLEIVRSEGRLLQVVEQELLNLQDRIRQGNGVCQTPVTPTEYCVDTFQLSEPLYIIGRADRVPYNKNEEKQQLINYLVSTFFGNDEPSMISNRAIPATGFGLVCECEKDMSMGTYMMGVQVTGLREIPEGMRSFILPEGRYARVTFQASDKETLTNLALEGAYDYLYNKWLPESGYIMADMMTAEVYVEDRMEVPIQPEMELWQLLMQE